MGAGVVGFAPTNQGKQLRPRHSTHPTEGSTVPRGDRRPVVGRKGTDDKTNPRPVSGSQFTPTRVPNKRKHFTGSERDPSAGSEPKKGPRVKTREVSTGLGRDRNRTVEKLVEALFVEFTYKGETRDPYGGLGTGR